MKYYIIAGEASGDLHGSNLMKALVDQDINAEFRFWGGDLMQNVRDSLVKHYDSLAFMGFLEVIVNLKTILNNIKFCKKDLFEIDPWWQNYRIGGLLKLMKLSSSFDRPREM